MYTIKETKEEIIRAITAYNKKDKDGSYILPEKQRLPILIFGAVGIGKTDIVAQAANELGIEFVSTSITHHTRNTALGLPVIKDFSNENLSYTEYTVSDIIAKAMEKAHGNTREGILLLDEFACISESLMPVMLAFLQTKNIGNYSLPKGWTIVCCANPTEYNRSSRKFDMAVTDRMRIINTGFKFEDFYEYGKANDMHPLILEYLSKNKLDCLKLSEADVVTPRGWENLSNCLKAYEKMEAPAGAIREELVGQFIKSDSISFRFTEYYIMSKSVINDSQAESVILGTVPKELCKKIKAKDYGTKWYVVKAVFNKLIEHVKPGKELEEALNNISELYCIYNSFDVNIYNHDSILAEINSRIRLGEDYGKLNKKITDTEIALLTKIADEIKKKVSIDFPLYPNGNIVYGNFSGPAYPEKLEEARSKALKIMDTILRNEKERLKSLYDKESSFIENAIKFISDIHKDNELVETLLSYINSDKYLLEVLSKSKCTLYDKYTKSMYLLDSTDDDITKGA